MITGLHPNSIELTWSKPDSDGGSPITGYILEMKETNRKSWRRVFPEPIKGTKCTVPDLSEVGEYEFRVIAQNELGRSMPSRLSEAVDMAGVGGMGML